MVNYNIVGWYLMLHFTSSICPVETPKSTQFNIKTCPIHYDMLWSRVSGSGGVVGDGGKAWGVMLA